MDSVLKLQIGRWGNSLGIRLPKHVLEALHLKAKDKVKYSIEDGRLIIEPTSPSKYMLEELLAQVKDSGEEIDWGTPRGEEVW